MGGACGTSSDRSCPLEVVGASGEGPQGPQRADWLCCAHAAQLMASKCIYVSHLLRAVSTRQAWIKFREANSQLMKPTSDVVINANLGPGLGVRDSGN